jgi:peptide/nickel transport system substrate-binding protein
MKVATFALLLFGLLLATACSPAGSDAPHDTIRIAIGSDLRSLEPGANRDTFTDDMMAHAVEGLVAYRDDLSVAPLLAEKIDLSGDGLTYTFTLRQDLVFHNGEPVTADDVVWSLQRLIAEDSRFLCKNWYDGSEGVAITRVASQGSNVVTVRLDNPDALFLDRLANFQCLAGIVHRDSVGADGKWKFPIGTGPYRFTDWSKGRFIEMERFAQYRPRDEPRSGLAGSRKASVPRLRWIVIPDPASARAGLLAGQVDIVSGIDANDLAELRLSNGIETHVAQSLDWNALLLQTNDPVLRDKGVRLAIAHAINREVLAEAVTLGISEANPSAISRSSSYHSPSQDVAPAFDPELARQYLARSRYSGEPITLTANQRFQNMFDNAIYIQAMLQDVGFNVELEVTEWSTQLSKYFAGDFQLMAFGYSARTDPVLAYNSFVGDKSTDGWAQWTSPKASALIAAASRQTDAAQRQRIFDELHELMSDDVPIIPLFNHYVIHASSDRLTGYEPWTANRVRLWGVSIDDAAS